MILDILSRNIESSLPSIKSYRSYMGSYNGLYNLYNNKASIASSHLWDWETSEYNIDFVKKLLQMPKGTHRRYVSSANVPSLFNQIKQLVKRLILSA